MLYFCLYATHHSIFNEWIPRLYSPTDCTKTQRMTGETIKKAFVKIQKLLCRMSAVQNAALQEKWTELFSCQAMIKFSLYFLFLYNFRLWELVSIHTIHIIRRIPISCPGTKISVRDAKFNLNSIKKSEPSNSKLILCFIWSQNKGVVSKCSSEIKVVYILNFKIFWCWLNVNKSRLQSFANLTKPWLIYN